MKYLVTQSFSTENNTEQDESLTQSFANKKDALKYFDEIKKNTQQGGQIVTDFWLKDEVIDSFYSNFDYSPLYGNLVVAYQHEGKGMGYCHKFLGANWLDARNSKHLSDNPDSRFEVWHTITDLKIEDLNGLTYEEAVEKVKDEVNLRWNNDIDLEGLGIEFAKDIVRTEVKTYQSNADVFFSVGDNSLGWITVYFSDVDQEETTDYNMENIKEFVLDGFADLKEDNQELDMDNFEFEIGRIAIHISPLTK
jgi:hypothetical protein